MEMDIAPVTPAAVVAASSVMTGNTVIESLSPPPFASNSRSLSPAPPKVEKIKRATTPGKDAPDVDVVVDEGDAELGTAMQPAHSAEALDVLATTELRSALLLEKLCAEKM